MKIITKGMLVGSIAAVWLAGPALAQELVYSSFLPPQHPDNTTVVPAYSERIIEGTEGRQSLRVHAGGVLASPGVVLEAIGDGVVDSGLVFYAYTPALAPTITLIGDLPGIIPQVSAAAGTETMLLNCPECLQEMEDLGVVILSNNASDSYDLYCASAKISTPEDARGLKVRASGGFAQLVAGMGMTPVNIAITEMYEAMQRGQVDCAVAAVSGGTDVQLWDVVKFVTGDLILGSPLGYSAMVVNRDLWDSFSEEDRAVWIRNAARMIADHERGLLSYAASASPEERGLEVVHASQELQDLLVASREQLISNVVAAATNRGVADPQRVADAFFASYDKWTAIYEEIGAEGNWSDAQWDAYAGRLQSEIYDKVSLD